MKIVAPALRSLAVSAAASFLCAAVLAVAAVAQTSPSQAQGQTPGQIPPHQPASAAPSPSTAPQSIPETVAPPPKPMHGQRNFPPPTNLKVLPKDLTGAQVRDIMRHWAGDLGQPCSTCHAAFPNRVGRNGKPVLDFASDENPEKQMARIMYTMLQSINKDYLPKVKALDTMGSPAPPVTCGTCHRGNLDPTKYVSPQREERGPRPGGQRGGQQGAPQGN